MSTRRNMVDTINLQLSRAVTLRIHGFSCSRPGGMERVNGKPSCLADEAQAGHSVGQREVGARDGVAQCVRRPCRRDGDGKEQACRQRQVAQRRGPALREGDHGADGDEAGHAYGPEGVEHGKQRGR